MRPIALLTDFGQIDGYVAAMKGVILTLHPAAVIVDITHEARPQAIDQAAYLLGATVPYLPPGTITVAVVDPGVGTDRPAIAIETPHGYLVGPDNGIWTDLLTGPGCAEDAADAPATAAEPRPLPPGHRAVRPANPAYRRPDVSSTFHGRDIFAPVAAHLARGVPLVDLGPPADTFLRLPLAVRRDPAGRLIGRVRQVDRFGNLITSIPSAAIAGRDCRITIGSTVVRGLARTFGDGPPGQPIALGGSSGYLEIAVPRGSAARLLGHDLGDLVIAEIGEGP